MVDSARQIEYFAPIWLLYLFAKMVENQQKQPCTRAHFPWVVVSLPFTISTVTFNSKNRIQNDNLIETYVQRICEREIDREKRSNCKSSSLVFHVLIELVRNNQYKYMEMHNSIIEYFNEIKLTIPSTLYIILQSNMNRAYHFRAENPFVFIKLNRHTHTHNRSAGTLTSVQNRLND